MKRINEDQKTLFVFSTHDPKVMEMASRIIHIRDGEIARYSHFDRRFGLENKKFEAIEKRTGSERRK